MHASFGLRLVGENFHLAVFRRGAVIGSNGAEAVVPAHLQQCVVGSVDYNEDNARNNRGTLRHPARIFHQVFRKRQAAATTMLFTNLI
jgi:hypothetical protein